MPKPRDTGIAHVFLRQCFNLDVAGEAAPPPPSPQVNRVRLLPRKNRG